MSKPLILFLHGLDSKPGGFKPRLLQSRGFEVLNPALPKESFSESVRIAQETYNKHQPPIIVGSSRGGAVAMSLKAPKAKLVLIAPAWRWCEVAPTLPTETYILHSPNDEVIPYRDSVYLLETANLPESRLVTVGKDHAMNDDEAITALEKTILRLAANRDPKED
jgi:predicted esterase YcpF (UPF0227 family)